ncbi:adhesin [Burkholderia ubonensis]|uniref:Adhesin n=1 Tax=Burkholderia ubonensis TaxID=101571 RepID=A0A1B4LHU3_9BURK|nr:adhesin [Burkholderia ubonensis]AOK13773.1 adhesin [Burkholderia vietnamiensis]KVE66878.1 adhesin [Burkholderia vietnamiensis]KVF14466.1 adhesin [Burkholderia vietnamiensis]KVF30422.1 adhesin [Burkholderia vietnamiensis]
MNDNGVQQANYNNDGATGVNALAAGVAASASGTDSLAVGHGANASANGATVIGANALGTGVGSVALGQNATASAPNSVALGSGSVASEANTVSLGSAGNERRLTNVAPGVNPTDGVNMSQLNSVRNDIGSVARKAYSGVAGAVALTMIPDVDLGKSFMIGIGSGSYQGYAAAAIGFTARLTDNLKLRGGASLSGSGTTFGVGIGYQW